ncbi:YciI family protein [Gammaproteobacteria bacterium]|nr:YciI family protein [Gammaproteobacteria bacterium]
MQFLVTAYDGKDDGALDRRMSVRKAHINGANELKEAGHLIAGGAILDEAEQMIGSTMFVEFDSKAELDQWLASDPYVTGDVWQDISVLPIRLAVT